MHDLAQGLDGADVVMALRIQRERIADLEDIPGTADYIQRYGISAASLTNAKPDAIVMHPGPMNRGVEIDSATADGPNSVIVEQVRNGVAIRQAVLETVAASLLAT